jgi:hypothetical protein
MHSPVQALREGKGAALRKTACLSGEPYNNSFGGEAEVGRAAEPSAPVENDPETDMSPLQSLIRFQTTFIRVSASHSGSSSITMW